MNKYNAKKCVIEGFKCDSLIEGRRWQELRIMERVGDISDLVHHPRYKLKVNDQLVCLYEADSSYTSPTGEPVVEDVKGARTGAAWAHFRTKMKLFAAIFAVEISIWPAIPAGRKNARAARTPRAQAKLHHGRPISASVRQEVVRRPSVRPINV